MGRREYKDIEVVDSVSVCGVHILHYQKLQISKFSLSLSLLSLFLPTMDPVDHELEALFVPYLTLSHMIPLVAIARLFAKRGVNVTIVTTPVNAILFQSAVDSDIAAGHKIKFHTLKFPAAEVGLPEGMENFNSTNSMETISKIDTALRLLRDPMEQLIRNTRPDCIVSDMFLPWTTDIADQLQIPRLVAIPFNFFFFCATHSLKLYAPHEKVESETESFVIPGLPDKIEITRSQLPIYDKIRTKYGEFMDVVTEANNRSYGTIINSLHELEYNYINHLKTIMGKKSWVLGPLSLFANREKVVTPDQHSSLSWLDTQKPNSVLYICFGSLTRFSDNQLREMALALEASKHPFVWVVRKRGKTEAENWLPEGFEERNDGLIIRGWAPQVLILEHPAIGGFMTHCGWGSLMESITAGVPVITWPLFAEQFYNEKVITQVFKMGVGVGSVVWNFMFDISEPVVGKENIEKAVNLLMGGSEEAEKIRRRAKEVGKIAKKAVEEGGSSYSDLTALIDELKACALEKMNHSKP